MSIIRVVGYVGAEQQLVMPAGYSADATAYLWGGGGGGGGQDARGQGGAGQGGGFVQQTISLNSGDILRLAVGGGGGGGRTSTGGGSGAAGASIIPDTLFDTRAQNDVTPVTYRRWGNFMNTHGVWGGSGNTFGRSYSVYFPYTGYYTFYASVDNIADISLDGGEIISIQSNFTTYEGLYNYTVSQGFHTISFTCVNTGGPKGFALVVTNNSINGFSGGRGGNAGPAGSSGGGGGGGGATVLQLNGEIIAVAGGGGGGGGAGNGPNGGTGGSGTTAPYGTTNGQNGQDKSGDGGGAGAGGGGWFAGNGGYCGSGDVGGGGGGSSTSLGTITANPTGRVPGGFNSIYYPAGTSSVAYGGAPGNGSAGGPGYAVIELVPHTILVHKDGVFNPALNTYIKLANQWRDVFGVFLKINGEWVPVAGVNSNYAPAFATNTNNFGINARGIDPQVTSGSLQWFGYGNQASQSGFGGGGGGGGGGGACFTPDTLVRTSSGTKPIVDITVGEQVWNWDGSALNTVTYIEQTLDIDFVALYTPDADHDCFATINHPLYINNELSSVVPDTVYELHPWLGRTRPLTPHRVTPAQGRSVYNLWTTGDGTYTVNGYGTTSIVGDGGMLRLMVEQNLMSAERVAQVLVHFNRQANRNLSQGAYLLNGVMGRLNIKFINRLFAAVYADNSRTKTQKVFEAIFKAVGRISLLKDRNA